MSSKKRIRKIMKGEYIKKGILYTYGKYLKRYLLKRTTKRKYTTKEMN